MQEARGGARTGQKWIDPYPGGQEAQGCHFFLAGREKSQPGSDFSDKDVDATKIIASALQAADAQKLDELLAAEILKEICNGK